VYLLINLDQDGRERLDDPDAPHGRLSDLAFERLAAGAIADCSDTRGQHGYFHPLIARHKVAGPIVTNQSRYDTAVGTYYPLGSRVAGQVDFAPGKLPKYGGLGTFGIQGPCIDLEGRPMLPPDGDYGFQGERVYNLEASAYINEGSGAAGAHSDIAKPALAHAFRQAIGADQENRPVPPTRDGRNSNRGRADKSVPAAGDRRSRLSRSTARQRAPGPAKASTSGVRPRGSGRNDDQGRKGGSRESGLRAAFSLPVRLV